MQAPDPDLFTDRREQAPLTFDAATGHLALGGHSEEVPAGSSNRLVLNAYVQLTARCRGDRIANLIEVRHADVEALARALDLDAAELSEEIQQVLGASRADALALVDRMRGSRRIGGLAGAVARSAATTDDRGDEVSFVDAEGRIWPGPPGDVTPSGA